MSTNTTNDRNKRNDLLYPDLSYKIIGVLFDIHNKLGFGLNERTYQNSVAIGLEKAGLKFKREFCVGIEYQDRKVGHNFLDFLIEDKIVLELKQGDAFLKNNITQALNYLKISGLKLAILANFTSRGLKYKRIINIV